MRVVLFDSSPRLYAINPKPDSSLDILFMNCNENITTSFRRYSRSMFNFGVNLSQPNVGRLQYYDSIKSITLPLLKLLNFEHNMVIKAIP